jgi:hypothetical protein
MKSKAWLTIFAVVALLLIGASGFFCFSAVGKFSEAQNNWGVKIDTIKLLEKKVPYPNQKNVDEVKTIVLNYQKSVDGLFTNLNAFQKELDKKLLNIEFPEKVKTKVNEFRQFATSSQFTIEEGDAFQLGFDAYSNSLPVPEIVPILDYELKAIDHLLRKIITSGGEAMSSFSRDLIPGEVGGPEKQENGVVHKYPVRLQMKCSHKAFQNFMNSISNDKEYFFAVRVLNIENEAQEGPFKGGGEGEVAGLPRFVKTETSEPAGPEELTKWGYPNASELDLAAAAKADGYEPAGTDARVLMGQEKLDVFMVVDVVRFLKPSEVVIEQPAKPATTNSRRNPR